MFPTTRKLLGQITWERLFGRSLQEPDPSAVLAALEQVAGLTHPDWLPDLARLELACHHAMNTTIPPAAELQQLTINPSLQRLQLPWRNLLTLLTFGKRRDMERIEAGNEQILIWVEPSSKNLRFETALPDHLLALELATNRSADRLPLTAISAARQDSLLWDAVRKGLLLMPQARLHHRNVGLTPPATPAAELFTLYWQLAPQSTHDQPLLAPDRTARLLQELRQFGHDHFVQPRLAICCHKQGDNAELLNLYRAAAEQGIATIISSAPLHRQLLEQLLAIQRPLFFQVSCCHQDNSIADLQLQQLEPFLQELRILGIPSQLLLVLEKGTLEQAIRLAQRFEGLATSLSSELQPGQGTAAQSACLQELQKLFTEGRAFPPQLQGALHQILASAPCGNFPGYCGTDCGAACTELTLQPDGTVHACRFYSSPIGSALQQGLEELYQGEAAAAFRSGINTAGLPAGAGCTDPPPRQQRESCR